MKVVRLMGLKRKSWRGFMRWVVLAGLEVGGPGGFGGGWSWRVWRWVAGGFGGGWLAGLEVGGY